MADFIAATPAGYMSARTHVDDHLFVEDGRMDTDVLVDQARSGLVWGRRLGRTPSAAPFAEPLLRYERAVARSKRKPGVMTSPVATSQWIRTMNDMKHGRIPYPKLVRDETAWSGRPGGVKRKKGVSVEETLARRKKLKNRTRAERIADLRAALKKTA
jgi:hypothetical protein